MNKPGIATYFATAGDNKVITAKPAILHKILIGKDVANSVIELSDHASDGDGNIVAQFDGSTLMTSTKGVIEVNAVFNVGICADLANQTQVTFIWSPLY